MKHGFLVLYSRCLFVLLGIGFITNIRILSHWTNRVSHDLRERASLSVEEKPPLLRSASSDAPAASDVLPASNRTDDDESPMDFRVHSWNSRFQQRTTRFEREDEQFQDDSSVPSDFESSAGEYSSVRVVEGEMGVKLLVLDNVCYNIYEKNTYVFSADKTYMSKKRIPDSDFPSKAWGFSEHRSKPLKSHHWVDEKGVYIMMFHSNRNIAHFTEVFNFVYHYLHHRAAYPSIHSVFFPQYQRDAVYPWITSYLDVASSLFKKHPFKAYFLEEMNSMDAEGVICFRHAIGVGRIISFSYGGVFTSLAEADSVRAASYKHYGLAVPAQNRQALKAPHVLVLQREAVHGNLPGRVIVNMEQVRRFFVEHKGEFVYAEKKLELMKPKDQVKTLLLTDILVGAQGSGFANVIYMLPGSVAIAFSPPNVGGFFFNTVSEFARVYYVGVYNSSVPFPPDCKNRINSNGESVIRACLDVLYAENIFMDPTHLLDLLRSATVHLKSYKFRL